MLRDNMPEPKLAAVEKLRTPPHSIEAEQAVLGGLLLSTGSWDQVADIVVEGDFYREDHRTIFRAIADLHDHGRPCDAVVLAEWFESHGKLDVVDKGNYISHLANTTPSAANILAYAEIVREKSILRSLIDAGTEITSGAYAADGRESKTQLETAERLVFAIADKGGRSRSGFVSIQDTIKQAIDKIQQLYEFEGEITGISTGFKDLDKKTAG
jgi:replicative DNA helicase